MAPSDKLVVLKTVKFAKDRAPVVKEKFVPSVTEAVAFEALEYSKLSAVVPAIVAEVKLGVAVSVNAPVVEL